MREEVINLSDTPVDGSSHGIYRTSQGIHRTDDCERLMLGTRRAGCGDPVEVVSLHLPHLKIHVRASDVREHLNVLLANRADHAQSTDDPKKETLRKAAYAEIRRSILRAAADRIVDGHLDRILRASYEDGMRRGQALLRSQLQALLGVRP
jgi:hypothetical protein